MKAEELMIGDWVMVKERKGDDVKDYPIIIYSGNIGDIVAENLIVKPIPLTSDILEKNSFLKVDAIEYPSHSVGISFLYRNTPEGLRIFVQNACAGGPTCTMIKTCKYVHEVQHMIKMCDIERTFVL
jgi:hypothetical protein